MTRHQWAVTLTAVILSAAISGAVAYHFGRGKDSSRGAVPYAGDTVPANAPCAPYADAGPLVGKSACISGRVLKVYTSKAGNTYLDFCEDYRSCPFSSVIFSQDRAKFGDLATLQGQFVEIRGLVSYYKERPQIIIRAPEQLKLRE